MNDLQLWNDLENLPPDDPGVGRLVLDFESSRSQGKIKADRWVFIGDLIRVFRHQPAEVQTSILRMLGGMRGRSSVDLITKCLASNSDLAMVETAIGSLLINGSNYHWQLVHAFFSSDIEIRRLAIEKIECPKTAAMGLHLLADPLLKDEVFERIVGLKISGDSVQTIFQFVSAKIITLQQSQWLLSGVDAWTVLKKIGSERPHENADEKLESLFSGKTSLGEIMPSHDSNHAKSSTTSFSLWLASILFSPELDKPLPSNEFQVCDHWHKQLRSTISNLASTQPEIVLGLLRWCSVQKQHSQPAIALAISLDLRAAQLRDIPLQSRKSGLTELSKTNGRRECSQQPVAWELLADDELTRRDSGQLDLAVVGSLLRCIQSPTKEFSERFKLSSVVGGFLESPEDSIPFFSAPLSGKYFSELLRAIWKQCNGKKRKVKICAMLVTRMPELRLEFLDRFSNEEWLELFDEFCQLAESSQKPISRKKLNVLAKQVFTRSKKGFDELLDRILAKKCPHENKFCIELFITICRETLAERIAYFAAQLNSDESSRFIQLIEYSDGVPYGIEWAVAQALSNNASKTVQVWARERIVPETKSQTPKPTDTGEPTKQLSNIVTAAIATCPDSQLSVKLRPSLSAPASGLIEALDRRPSPISPNLHAVCALAGCLDDATAVDRVAAKFAPEGLACQPEFDHLCVTHWQGNKALPLMGHACLWIWEQHLFRLDDQIEKLNDLVQAANQLTTYLFSNALWRAATRLAKVQASRNKPRFDELISPSLVENCVAALTGQHGVPAAEILVVIFRTRPIEVQHQRAAVMELMPSISDEARSRLKPWVATEGLATTSAVPRGRPIQKIDAAIERRVRACKHVPSLVRFCQDPNWKVVDLAVSRLVELGDAGVEAIVELLLGEPPICLEIVAETIPYWDAASETTQLAWELLGDAVVNRKFSTLGQFLLGVNLLQCEGLQQNKAIVDSIIDAIRMPNELHWFTVPDWHLSVKVTADWMDELEFAIAVSTSEQPHAYLKAVNFLISGTSVSQRHIAAVEDFLKCGSDRAYDTRLAAARWLAGEGSSVGLPILMAALKSDSSVLASHASLTFAHLKRIARSIAATGDSILEQAFLSGLAHCRQISAKENRELHEWLMAHSSSAKTVDRVLDKLPIEDANSKLGQVARTFKWGMDQALNLLGQKFAISMLANEDLGYTRLNQNKIFVNILPIMDSKQHGQEIVEGLILHELGHHIYHKGKSKEKIWDMAQQEGLHSLLNVVADEHLERNLRTADKGYDAKLKRLSAFAFQHNQKEMPVATLLLLLGVHALEVLSSIPLKTTDSPHTVRVDNGKLLAKFEKSGSSFAKFFRALRMGLGNRYNDPKVAAALKLFDRSFRDSSMKRLYEIAVELRSIFQQDACFLNFICQDRLVAGDSLTKAKGGKGLTDAMIDREIRRITSREELKSNKGSKGGRAINVIDEIDFSPISQIVQLPFDQAAAQELDRSIALPAKTLRRYLTNLGEKYVHQRRRLNGFRIDQGAINRLVIRKDPRVMVARQRQFQNNLFVGMAIDCSGSMAYNENMELAKRFGALLAGAIRDVDGIDLNIIGFTDETIFDVGDKHRNSIHALESGGGNNDAAALWHVAQKAINSKRKSKLLVMISDGMPTECSVQALRTLVRKLTHNFGICCAQVAVEELEEVCFPNYVLVKSETEMASIRKFGATIAKLIKQSIGK